MTLQRADPLPLAAPRRAPRAAGRAGRASPSRQARRRQALRRAVQAPGGAAAPARVPALADARRSVRRGPRASGTARSLAGRVELALAAATSTRRSRVLGHAPGMLLRGVDRLLRRGRRGGARGAVRAAAPGGLHARAAVAARAPAQPRRARRPCACSSTGAAARGSTADDRPPLPADTVAALAQVLDAEIAGRLPACGGWWSTRRCSTSRVPLTARAAAAGSGCCRAARSRRSAANVRFFVYWKQRERATDYDLSVLMLDDDFVLAGQVSWTNLTELGAVHSGDITEAPERRDGVHRPRPRARLRALRRPAGQRLQRGGLRRRRGGVLRLHAARAAQRGRPFEPRTVRAEVGALRSGRVVTARGVRARDDGRWRAKWMHLGLGRAPAVQPRRGQRAQHLAARPGDRRASLPAGLLPRGSAAAGAGGRRTGRSRSWWTRAPRRAYRPDSTVYTPANLPELLNSA